MNLEPVGREGALRPPAARRQGDTLWRLAGRHRALPLILLGALLGALAHLAMLVLFARVGLTIMAVANAASIALWLLGGIVAWRGYLGSAIGIACAEMVAHAWLAVWQVGLGAGFQHYMWSAACLLVLNPFMRSDLALAAGVFVSLLFASIHLVFPVGAILPALDAFQVPLYFMNALCAPLPVVFVVIMVRQAFKSQQAALREVAARDEVTGIFNRRHGMRVLRKALDAWQPDDGALFVMLGDVDHFKAVNDTHGHHVGDLVLAQVAGMLAARLRSDDMLCRWGGEEFLMVFPDFPPDGVRERMDEVRRALASPRDDALPKVTMSFGLTRARPGDTVDEIVRRADALMYEAKHRGRNCIVDDLQPRAVAIPTNVEARPAGTD